MGWEGPGSIACAVRHAPGTVQDGTPVPVRHAGIPSGGKGGRSCCSGAGFGGGTGGVDWLCSVPKVPATVLVLTQLRCQDTWDTTTTASVARMAQASQASPGL